MFKTFLTKDAQNGMSIPDMYLLAQTLRINNSLKVFALVADDIRKHGPDDIVNTRKFMELLLYYGANLHEILEVLRLDLFPRYKEAIKEPNLLTGLLKWEERIKAQDETIRVLHVIRNKHAFHVPYDQNYVWEHFNDDPAKEDVLIGLGETMHGNAFFYTWDVDMLFLHLREHVLIKGLTEAKSWERVKNIIDTAAKELYSLFNSIAQYMLNKKIFSVGDKEQAKREYGKDD